MQFVDSVGLLLFNSKDEILIIQELEDKIHYEKMAGMLSVPIESVEFGENNLQTLRRLIIEEVGPPIALSIKYIRVITIRLNAQYTERLHVYKGKCAEDFDPCPTDTDIKFYDWMSIEKIEKLDSDKLRVEMAHVMPFMRKP